MNYADKYVENMVNVGYHSLNRDEMKSAFEKYFNEYESVLVLDKNNFKIKNESYYKVDDFVILNNYYALVKPSEKKDLNVHVELKKIRNYKNKQQIGEAKIYIKDELLHSEKIYIVKKEEHKKSFFSKLIGWFKKW